MSKISDQGYLKQKQYNDASKLNARVELHARFSTNAYGWQRWVFDQLQLAPASRVLEIGCGPGRLWLDNRDRIPADWAITLSDFSAGMLDQARRNLSDAGRQFAFELADVQAMPFGAAAFDAVIANHMLYHVPDRPRALAEIARVLRPGGRLFSSTIGERHLAQLFALVQRFDPALAAWGGLSTHEFSLENGAAQLAPWFEPLALRRYDDRLIVTEVAPLVAFILSMHTLEALPDARRAELEQFVERELQAQGGAIEITKDSGLFGCVL